MIVPWLLAVSQPDQGNDSLNSPPSSSAAAQPEGDGSTEKFPPPFDIVTHERTIEQVRAEHAKIEKDWLACEARQRLISNLTESPASVRGTVTQIVALGIGSLSEYDENDSCNYYNSLLQLACVQDMARSLAPWATASSPEYPSISRSSSSPEDLDVQIKIFAQDPAFTEVDMQFLRE